MIKHKTQGFYLRVKDIPKLIPIRIKRLVGHLLVFCWSNFNWWLEFTYLLLDLAGVPEIYETIIDLFKWNTRPLTEKEITLLQPLFGKSIDYKRVRIDESAYLGPKQKHFCYVSFYTINSWGSMNDGLLIHEIVHIWQFQQMGSVYIPRALAAQQSKEGYNYGGAPKIVEWALNNGRLTDFNLEQQADIVADCWRLQNGLPLQWGPAGVADLPHYLFLVGQIEKGV